MTDSIITYIVVSIMGILVIFSFSIGIEKMIKIILGNYILGSICLAATESIRLIINYLNLTPDLKFIGLTYKALGTFLTNGHTTIILIFYIILLVLIYKKSSINVKIPMDEGLKKILYILFVPMTVISVILTLQIAIMGIGVLNFEILQNFANNLTKNIYIYKFLTLTPVWILLHGIATILITSEMKMNIKTDL
ncbi:MAG: hypothetical protein WC872_03050 [Candidatus Absconditabacterales bacterium]